MKEVSLVLLGVVGNTILAVIKLLAGVLGNSYALVADAVESMVDIVGSLIVLGGLRVAGREPDEQFPYGYGKAEALAAFVVGFIILGAAVAIAVKAILEIMTPHHSPAPFTLWVLLGVVVVKEGLHWMVQRSNRDGRSVALSMDAFHHRSDALTSGAAALGISIAWIGGERWAPADDWAALLATGIIFYNGFRILQQATQHLLDRQPGELVVQRIKLAAEGVGKVEEVEKLSVRQSGSGFWVDIHIHAHPEMSLLEAHNLSGQVKAAIMRANSDVWGVLVHMEPGKS